ncbi:MAG: DegV family protein [Ruthenibacterium sp.]|jgi:DegV family protein with EDD domain
MAPYRILTDSTTDLSPALVEKMNVTVLSLMFTMDGKTYRNTPDEADMPSKVFYDKVRAGSMPTTSQITPMDFKEAVGPILAGGEDVLYLAFSSGLSGTYNNSRIAFAELAEEYPQRKVICVDTLGASMGEGLLVYLACQQRDKGKSIEEVAQWVEENRLRLAHWFTVDDLNHLKRGGRVSGAAAFFGTMLSIKPVLHVDDEGHLIPMEKVRGRRQSLDALVEHMAKTGIDNAHQTVFISHGDCKDDVEYVAQQIRQRFGTTDIYINPIGPVIGAHSGPGTVALFFLAEGRG